MSEYKKIDKKISRQGVIYYEDDVGKVTKKQCTKCMDIKSIDEFNKLTAGFKGLRPECKKCRKLYHDQHRERELTRMREWRRHNKDHIQDYEERNKEKRKEAWKDYYDRNKERISEADKVYYQNNKHVYRLKDARRRARLKQLPDDLTTDQRDKILKNFNYKCALTGDKERINLDHVIPISTGYGGTTYSNIIPLRSDLNFSKSDSNIFDWFPSNKNRFNLYQERFEDLIKYLSEINNMTTDEYKRYVDWCFEKQASKNIEDRMEG